MKKAFTIVELLVAVALLAMLIAISGIVFSAAVKAYRIAGASNEIAGKLQVITQQLDDDFRGLQKDGEFIVAWSVSPEIERNNPVPTIVDKNGDGVPDRYVSFDRLLFFTTGNFQTYLEQQTTAAGVTRFVSGDNSIARICYSFGRDAQDTRAQSEPQPEKRLFCRTQHILSSNTDLPPFPDMSVSWDAVDFETKNFTYEYQTMPLETWSALTEIQDGIWDYLSAQQRQDLQTKLEMLSCLLDLQMKTQVLQSNNSWHPLVSSVTQGGPRIDVNNYQGLHQLFLQGVGQFQVQVWWYDTALNRYRWYPEIDPDQDGIYNEGTGFSNGRTDYPLVGNLIDTTLINGRWVWNANDMDAHVGSALKFTFTLYDSNGVFKEGKTFTHIVYLK